MSYPEDVALINPHSGRVLDEDNVAVNIAGSFDRNNKAFRMEQVLNGIQVGADFRATFANSATAGTTVHVPLLKPDNPLAYYHIGVMNPLVDSDLTCEIMNVAPALASASQHLSLGSWTVPKHVASAVKDGTIQPIYDLFNGSPAPATATMPCGVTSGSNSVTTASTAARSVGELVTGTGIPDNTVIKAITNGTTFTLGNMAGADVNATATNAATTLTFATIGAVLEIKLVANITTGGIVTGRVRGA